MAKVYDEHSLLIAAQSDNTLHVTIVDHPLVRASLGQMRNVKSSKVEFHAAIASLTPHLIYAATRDLSETNLKISTPLSSHVASSLQDKIVLIPVLRSGIGMLAPAQAIFPSATTIFAGMARDEATAIPHWYYDLKKLDTLKNGAGTVFVILDPMLATGGSAAETIKRIKEIYPAGKIKLVSMIASPEGIRLLNQVYRDVTITVAAVDDHLNTQKYIVPGLGDAGDRQFGTI